MNICVYIYQDVFPILLHLPETTHLHNTSKLLLSLVFSLSLPPALLTRCSLTTHSLLTRFSLFIFLLRTTTERSKINKTRNGQFSFNFPTLALTSALLITQPIKRDEADAYTQYPSVPKTASINGFADRIYALVPDCAKDCLRESTGSTPAHTGTPVVCVSCRRSQARSETVLPTTVAATTSLSPPAWPTPSVPLPVYGSLTGCPQPVSLPG